MDSLSEKQLYDIYEFAVDLGKRAGALLLDGANARIRGIHRDGENMREKENSVDIVTQTDHDVEEFIHSAIKSRYPSHHFIGEETYASQAQKEYLIGQEPAWCVDPLDGTVNYTHLFPTFCVSIAFILRGKPVIGVIFAPFLNQLYTACKGRGAFLHHTHPLDYSVLSIQRLPLIREPQVPPLPADAPKGCIFVCEWGKDRRDIKDGNLHRKIESFMAMAKETNAGGGMVHGIRSLGSAALGLAYVATGGTDIWWEGGCWEWDVAAGIAILQEAGGLITDANPPSDWEDASPVPEVRLGSRLYLAIRASGAGPNETGRQAQERVVREVWKRVQELNYTRPGA